MSRSNARDRGAQDAAEQRASLIGLGLAVEQLRLEARMTRDAVAKGGGLTGNTITRVEKGLKEEVGWGTVRRLAKGLKVEVKDLTQLGLDLAPGPAGDRIRQGELEANDSYAQELIAKVADEQKG